MILKIELKNRERQHVSIYFEKKQDEELKSMLPSAVTSVEEPMGLFEATQLSNATSFGKVIYVNGQYVGDVWCYCINEQDQKSAMLSFALFDKKLLGKGVMTIAFNNFFLEIVQRYKIQKISAHCYSTNHASIKVLEKSGFQLIESFIEEGNESKYLEKLL